MRKENNTSDNHPVVQTSTSKGDSKEIGQASLVWPFSSTPGDYYRIPETGEIRPEIVKKIEQISQGKY